MSMSSFGLGSSASDPCSERLNRFFGTSPASSPPAVQRVPIGRLPTESSQELLDLAARRALEDGTSDLDTEHLLWAATKVEPARGLPARAGADPDALASQLAEVLPREAGEPSAEPGLTPAAKRTLATAYARSRTAGVSHIGPEHILGALLDGGDTGAARLLSAEGQDIGRLEGLTEQAGRAGGSPAGGGGKPATTLDEFGRDPTDEAKAGKPDPEVGRAEEIEQTVEILSRRSKNNPVLIGEPGVGRTAIVEGLAQRIGAGEVPMLKPALARGELHVVGATTIDEYRKYVEKDAALERRFQPVMVLEPTVGKADADEPTADEPTKASGT